MSVRSPVFGVRRLRPPRRGEAAVGVRRGFTLVEMMISIAILMIMGVIIIGFLRGALSMTRTGTARGVQFETVQTVLTMADRDFSQVIGLPAHPHGTYTMGGDGTEPRLFFGDGAFVVTEDPWGRQLIAFTRAWGEEQSSLAGYDAGRGAPRQGWRSDFNGRNVRAAMRPSRGNIEVVYMLAPGADGTGLYRAERSPPDRTNGLIGKVYRWSDEHEGAGAGDDGPYYALTDPESPYALSSRDGPESLWSQFELVADNVLAFSVECWDDLTTRRWHSGPDGPVTRWSMTRQLMESDNLFALPKALRLTLIVAAEEPLRSETETIGELGEGESSVFVNDTSDFPGLRGGNAFIRVNGEIIAYGSRVGQSFGSAQRGALGSRPQAHPDGSTVLAGQAFRKVIQLPVTR